MSAHTPGPWVLARTDGTPYDRTIYGAAFTDELKQIVSQVRGGSVTEANANARLIAAAPDLLAALESAVETIKTWHSIHDSDDGAWDIYRAHAPEMQAINAALAKATGTDCDNPDLRD